MSAIPVRHRVAAWTCAAILVAVIGVLTLMPQPRGELPTFGHWCVVCGRNGVADFVANVLLFIPLGAALALAGVRPARSAAACGALSVAIEVTQLLAIPGRFATFGDVVSNTLGGVAGVALVAAWRGWAAPAPPLARRLVTVGVLAWIASYALGAWALGLDAPLPREVAPPSASSLPHAPGYGWFAGRPTDATVDGTTIPHAGTGPVLVSANGAPLRHAEVRASGVDARGDFVPILYVHDAGDSTARLVLAEEGRHAAAAVRLRAARLRLRALRTVVPDAFAGAGTAPYALEASVVADSLTLGIERAGVTRRSVLRLAPSLAWALLTPIPRADGPLAPLATMAWLAGLALPLGYWAARAAAGRREGALSWVVVVTAIVVAAIAAIPPAAGFAAARPWEWGATLGGVWLGVALARWLAAPLALAPAGPRGVADRREPA